MPSQSTIARPDHCQDDTDTAPLTFLCQKLTTKKKLGRVAVAKNKKGIKGMDHSVSSMVKKHVEHIHLFGRDLRKLLCLGG